MLRYAALTLPLFCLALLAAGCGNPIKRDPANVYPGSEEYAKRIASFKVSPEQAYEIAHTAAQTDNKLQFLSRRPTVVAKRWYVFSMPQASGASLQGYHVNGDTGAVKFEADKKTVEHTKR